MQREIEKRPVGGLDMTTNYQDVNPVDYVDAKNLTNNERDINSAVDLKGIKGIEKVVGELNYTIFGTKKVRILVTTENDPAVLSPGNICSVVLKNSKDVPFTVPYTIANPPILTITDLRNEIDTYLNSSIPITVAGLVAFVSPVVLTTTSTTYVGYFDIYFNVSDDWILEFQPLAPNNVKYEVQIIEESISTYVEQNAFAELIGSCRTENDTFLFWTNVDEIKDEPIANQFILNNVIGWSNVLNPLAASNTRITFSQPHGLETGNIVNLFSSAPGVMLNYEGLWTITKVNNFNIDLNWSAANTFIPFSPLAIDVNNYIHGYGCITVATRDQDQDTQYTDTKLLVRAKGLNFSKLHQIDARVKKNNLQTILKFTDNNNPPKMMIYDGPYNNNGFIYGLNGYDSPIQGMYFYETISETSKMLIGENNLKLSVATNSTGGKLRALNYVYYARGVFSDYTKTTYSRPTYPISVIYSETTGSQLDGYKYTGSLLNTITTKSNTVTISNIPPRTFSYIELIVIDYYNSGSFVGGIVKREPIGIADTSVSITHTAEEIYEPIDEATINQLYLSITKALNIEELDNRGVLSNVELQIDEDLTTIVQNIEYAVIRHILPVLRPLSGQLPGNVYGEFQNPENQHKYTGYMLFETVRWGLRVKWKNSNWSKVYWVGDFRVDDSPIGGRRYGTLPNYDLNGVFGNFTYTFGFEFRNFNLDAIVNGVRLRDLIDDYEFVRAKPSGEIVATGIVMCGWLDTPSNPDVLVHKEAIDPNSTFPYAGNLQRDKIFFFSPDLLYDDAPPLEYFTGDELLCMGQPYYIPSTVGLAPYGNYTQTGVGEGFEHRVDQGCTAAQLQVIPISSIVRLYGDSFLGNGFARYDAITPLAPNFPVSDCYGITLSGAGVVNVTPTYVDKYCYNVFYRRPKIQPYAETPENTIYYSIGFFGGDVINDTFTTTHTIFGGDSFVQKTYLYTRNTSLPVVGNSLIRLGLTSINKTNCQQQFGMYPGFSTSLPSTSYNDARTKLFTNNKWNTEQVYSSCFTPRVITSQHVPYDKNSYENVNQSATIYWSEISFVDSKYNPDRYFLFANQRALDLSYGPIKDMKSINDILITLQPKKTERQYFDNTGKLISDSTDILLGTGAVMGRKGDFLSAYGCSNKWGSFVGKSTGGKEVLYYIDSINKAIVRVGADGTVVLSDRNNMSNYLYDHVKLAEFFDRPVYDYGISGIWDQKNRWAIFSVKAHLPTYEPAPTQWSSGISYSPGAVVYDEYAYHYYGQLPALYVCIAPHVSSIVNEPARMSPVSKDAWQLIPVTDTRYYNYFTLVFSETENKFKWFMSPVCSHYASYYDSYIISNPANYGGDIGFQNNLYYLDESGERCEWFKYYYRYTGRYPSGISFVYAISGNMVFNTYLYQLIPVYELSKNIQIYFIGPDDGVEYEVIDYYSDNSGTFMILNQDYPFPSGIYYTLELKISLKEDAYFTMSVNETKGQLVKYGAIRYDAELPVYRTDFTTSQPLQSYLTQADFESIDTYEYSPIKNDTTAGNSPDDDTSFLYGKYCLIKTTLRAKTEQIIHKFVTRVRALNRIIPR